MLILDPNDELENHYAIQNAVRKSGLSLNEISERLSNEYGVTLSVSGVSHFINRGAVQLQRTLQILAICGVNKVEIKGTKIVS